MNIPLNIDWQQILLHFFNFVVLFAILYFLLYSPVKKFMEQRQQYFADLELQAQEALQSAEQIKAQYENQLGQIAGEITVMKEKAAKEAEEASDLMLKRAQAESEQMLKTAREAIEQDHKKMLTRAKNEISDIVLQAVEKIVSSEDTAASYDSFLESVKRGDEHA